MKDQENMKQFTLEEMLERFVPDTGPSDQVKRDRDTARMNLVALAVRFPKAEAVVLFENVQMDSSSFGERKMVVVGPGCSIESVAACEDKWLNDLPSQRLYPQGCLPVGLLPDDF